MSNRFSPLPKNGYTRTAVQLPLPDRTRLLMLAERRQPDMATRTEITAALDEYLDIGMLEDASLNGLQVEGAEEVSRAALAVDASQATIEAAVDADCQFLFVHHGLFWGHYATETFGVSAIGDWLAEQFNIETIWIEHPTGI